MTQTIKPGQSVIVTVKPISPKGKSSQEVGIFQRYERNVKDQLWREAITYVVEQTRPDRIKPVEMKFYSHNILSIKPNE